MDEESKGMGKERCALLLYPNIWERVEAHGWNRFRMGSRESRNSEICVGLCAMPCVLKQIDLKEYVAIGGLWLGLNP